MTNNPERPGRVSRLRPERGQRGAWDGPGAYRARRPGRRNAVDAGFHAVFWARGGRGVGVGAGVTIAASSVRPVMRESEVLSAATDVKLYAQRDGREAT